MEQYLGDKIEVTSLLEPNIKILIMYYIAIRVTIVSSYEDGRTNKIETINSEMREF